MYALSFSSMSTTIISWTLSETDLDSLNNSNIPNQSNNNRPKSIYNNDISNNYNISNFQPQNI